MPTTHNDVVIEVNSKKKHNKSLLCKTSHALSPNNNKWKSVLQEKRAADWRMRW